MPRRWALLGAIFLLMVTGCTAPTSKDDSAKPELAELVPADSNCSTGEYADGSRVIRKQLAAFGRKDASGAYELASAAFKSRNTLEDFISILNSQYSMLFDIESYQIQQCAQEGGLFYFLLTLLDRNGQDYSMEYALSKVDGRWGVEGAAVSMSLN
jgi:hypothetical protein